MLHTQRNYLCDALAITTLELHSTKLELRLYVHSNYACSLQDIWNSEDILEHVNDLKKTSYKSRFLITSLKRCTQYDGSWSSQN